MNSINHTWSFSTVGGVKRVNLESGEDLKHLDQLDQKLWTALSCPVDGLEIDARTLQLIDKDNDGQIRVPEIIVAVKWVTALLKNSNTLLEHTTSFPIYAINDETEEGKHLLSSARIVLKNLGKGEEEYLTVEETTDTIRIFTGTAFNGDGVITEDSTDQAELKTIIQEIISCLGYVQDRGGKPGINEELLHQFFTQVENNVAWVEQTETNSGILFLGNETESAYQSFEAVRSKIEDYFIRCRLAAFDADTISSLNQLEQRVEEISNKDLSLCMDEIAGYPLAKAGAGNPLSLSAGINPAWEKKMAIFRQLACMPVFPGKSVITEEDWGVLCARFEPYKEWLNSKQGAAVEGLGLPYLKQLLSNNIKPQLLDLINRDKELENEANGIILLDQLVRYHRDLFRLLRNFVTFYDFYSPDSNAIFLAGTLYIDQRSCDLCIKVNDMAKHNSMVSLSGMYLLYCECTSKANNEKMTIVAALTNGDIDNLVVGRNALFYDKSGRDWDATVVKIVDNPISIKQAFWSPYRKVTRFIEAQVHKFASSQENKVDGMASKNIEGLPAKIETEQAPKAPAPPFDVGKFVGIIAAIGLAIGAIGTAIASFISGFLGLVWWKMPIAMAGLLLLISGPSMIMAYLKLRKRNLAPLLDANGWAVNARAVVNIQFGNTLTHLAELPKGARINLNDPFTKKKRPMLPFLFLLAIIAGIVIFLLVKYGIIHLH